MGTPTFGKRGEKRTKLSMLRRKVAERLVSVKNETAMLTTFNEVDMSAIYEIRNEYKDAFKERHNVSLGFMSFFTLAVVRALKLFPDVNSMIDDKEKITYEYCDISIAVSGPKGLMVPVIRNAENLSFRGVEAEVKRLAIRAREGQITVDEMTGGTFTITNGGVFGSMLSTPIINPPQSAILGMHNVVDRAIVRNGQIVVAPVMYIALSYDHRLIDGRESVGFLVEIPLAKKFYLEPGAQLTFLGTEYRNVKRFYSRDSDYSRDYYYEGDKVHITQLNLPLWFKFNAVAGLRPKVGAYVGYLASVRERRRGTSSKIEGRYLNSDFDFGLGAGVEYHFRTGFFLDTNINIGLANLSARGEVQNIFLQTGVGYKF